jgi:hypothetical protein
MDNRIQNRHAIAAHGIFCGSATRVLDILQDVAQGEGAYLSGKKY